MRWWIFWIKRKGQKYLSRVREVIELWINLIAIWVKMWFNIFCELTYLLIVLKSSDLNIKEKSIFLIQKIIFCTALRLKPPPYRSELLFVCGDYRNHRTRHHFRLWTLVAIYHDALGFLIKNSEMSSLLLGIIPSVLCPLTKGIVRLSAIGRNRNLSKLWSTPIK